MDAAVADERPTADTAAAAAPVAGAVAAAPVVGAVTSAPAAGAVAAAPGAGAVAAVPAPVPSGAPPIAPLSTDDLAAGAQKRVEWNSTSNSPGRMYHLLQWLHGCGTRATDSAQALHAAYGRDCTGMPLVNISNFSSRLASIRTVGKTVVLMACELNIDFKNATQGDLNTLFEDAAVENVLVENGNLVVHGPELLRTVLATCWPGLSAKNRKRGFGASVAGSASAADSRADSEVDDDQQRFKRSHPVARAFTRAPSSHGGSGSFSKRNGASDEVVLPGGIRASKTDAAIAIISNQVTQMNASLEEMSERIAHLEEGLSSLQEMSERLAHLEGRVSSLLKRDDDDDDENEGASN